MKILILALLATSALAVPFRYRYAPGGERIVGGTEATPGEFPHQISFQDNFFSDFHFCGGSVYSNTWMITAAHCVQGENFDNPQNLQVVAGDHTLYTNEGTEQTVAVDKIVQHENYSPLTISNDIALLRVATPLTFNSNVQPVAMPSQGQDSTGDAIVTGWGTTSEGGSSSNVLLEVTVPIVTDDDCRDSYGQNRIDDSMICAGLPEGGKDACQGDSGGPMICDLSGSRYLCGIVSWGSGCARPGLPGVYAETAYFVDWVQANAV